MSGGGGGAVNTIDENPLPDWARTSVENYLTEANNISTATPPVYSGATYAVRNQNEIDGIAALATRADDGSAAVNLGITLLVNTLQGDHLTGYPQKDAEWTVRADEAYDDFIYITLPAIAVAANNSGGFGGSGHQKRKIAAARKLFNALAAHAYEIYGADYFTERGYMTDAIVQAESYAEGSIADIETLRLSGLFEREYQQGLLEDVYRLWIDEQTNTILKLDVMGNAIRAMVGSSVEKNIPYYRPSEMAEIAGIALVGASAIGSFYGDVRNPATGGSKKQPVALPSPEST